jgi:hypothetical protein
VGVLNCRCNPEHELLLASKPASIRYSVFDGRFFSFHFRCCHLHEMSFISGVQFGRFEDFFNGNSQLAYYLYEWLLVCDFLLGQVSKRRSIVHVLNGCFLSENFSGIRMTRYFSSNFCCHYLTFQFFASCYAPKPSHDHYLIL